MISLKSFFRFLIYYIGSIVTCWLFAEAYWLLFQDHFVTDKDHVMIGLFVGLPLGNIVSAFLFKEKIGIKKSVLGFIYSSLSIICGLWLSDLIGNLVFIVIPMVISLIFLFLGKQRTATCVRDKTEV